MNVLTEPRRRIVMPNFFRRFLIVSAFQPRSSPIAAVRGEVEKLKPEYRLALARHGYALVTCESAVFKPEMCSA